MVMSYASNPTDGIRRKVAAELPDPTVVDAGCGSAIHVDLPESAYLVGVDVSQAQLERNPGLSRRICADLQTVDLADVRADLVVCWAVLEHLPRPTQALDRLLAALKPGGLMVVAAPNAYSLKGLATKFSPHWFHLWFYSTFLGKTATPSADTGPFPTYMRMTVSPRGLSHWAARRGLETLELVRYEDAVQARFLRQQSMLGRVYRVTGSLLRAFTLGGVSFRDTDFVMLLRKGGT